MGLRLLSYMVQLWEMQRRLWEDAGTPESQWELSPIIPLVFYTGRRKWARVPGLDALMKPLGALRVFVPQHQALFLNLAETASDTLQGSAVGWALRALQEAEAPVETLQEVLQKAVRFLEGLPEAQQAEWRRAMRYLLLLIRHKREPEERNRLYQVVVDSVEDRHEKEVSEMARTDAQVLIAKGEKQGREEGRKEGRKEGREEGRLEGRREMLKAQLEYKFGPLSEETLAAIEALTEAELNDVAMRVLTAQTLEELGL